MDSSVEKKYQTNQSSKAARVTATRHWPKVVHGQTGNDSVHDCTSEKNLSWKKTRVPF